jgi:hypothetical protein
MEMSLTFLLAVNGFMYCGTYLTYVDANRNEKPL